MTISISNTILSTQIFSLILFLALVLTTKKKSSSELFSNSRTQEIKGLAILLIVFSHIGYFLVADHRFLFPLTIAAGVGVDLFLFLSGFGLVLSALSRPLSIWQFYQRRLPKLYLPFWLTLVLFLGLDFFLLHRVYDFSYIGRALLGVFLSADVALDLNSPLWYFSWIIFYYLLFPIVFFRQYPWLTALILYLIGYGLVQWNPTILNQVMRLYQLHILAFPLGVFFGGLVANFDTSKWGLFLKSLAQRTVNWHVLRGIAYWCSLIALLWLAGYTAYYSNYAAERWLAEATSLVTGGAILLIAVLCKLENKLLYWFGLFSYEVYLLHWPILSRFDIFYSWAPAWLATACYLIFFLALSWLMRWLFERARL
jgi:peptidoglycan/LPS O-acetylase OafA/YrhL